MPLLSQISPLQTGVLAGGRRAEEISLLRRSNLSAVLSLSFSLCFSCREKRRSRRPVRGRWGISEILRPRLATRCAKVAMNLNRLRLSLNYLSPREIVISVGIAVIFCCASIILRQYHLGVSNLFHFVISKMTVTCRRYTPVIISELFPFAARVKISTPSADHSRGWMFTCEWRYPLRCGRARIGRIFLDRENARPRSRKNRKNGHGRDKLRPAMLKRGALPGTLIIVNASTNGIPRKFPLYAK